MAKHFDAYHELLAIPPDEQPPNHYRLLGVSLFEGNRQVVANAAMQRRASSCDRWGSASMPMSARSC